MNGKVEPILEQAGKLYYIAEYIRYSSGLKRYSEQ